MDIVADIGGTNARLQLWNVEADGVESLRSDKRYRCAPLNHGTPATQLDLCLNCSFRQVHRSIFTCSSI